MAQLLLANYVQQQQCSKQRVNLVSTKMPGSYRIIGAQVAMAPLAAWLGWTIPILFVSLLAIAGGQSFGRGYPDIFVNDYGEQ
ncbi:hypothetical protein [Paracoccus albus]|uniref:hypothetical protein n=1 Tax=Paracoccus albus TaxID=3017784 RepID=UPI0022EFE095|nr:hypothetical protein [Paracoccus albus]WBU61664.1 hypothetical protein PAF20_07145 [Paracoccus albus]